MIATEAVDAGAELLANLLGDASENVRVNALEAFLRRVYRKFDGLELEITSGSEKVPPRSKREQLMNFFKTGSRKVEGPTKLSCSYTYAYPTASSALRNGYCRVVKDIGELKACLSEPIPMSGDGANTMQIVVSPAAFSSKCTSFYSNDVEFMAFVADARTTLRAQSAALEAAGVVEVGVTLAQTPYLPRSACFLAAEDWAECAARRDMRPTFATLLEVDGLSKEYDLERIIPTIGRNSQVFLGASKTAKARAGRKPPGTVFARMISHTLDMSGDWMQWPEELLINAVDELERARLNPKVGSTPNSSILAHFMSNVDMSAAEANGLFTGFLDQFVAKHGARLQKSKVDEIIVKVGIGKEGEARQQTLRITASSMTGEYLKTSGLLEEADPRTGMPAKWFGVDSGAETPIVAANAAMIQMKRQVARSAGSTYASEFLGMMKVELIKKWSAYQEAGGKQKVPADLFADVELVRSAEGVLEESTRSPGENTCGVVAWRCTMRTPEYPEGRDIVVIANDVTYQAGSFGVMEDIVFQQAGTRASAARRTLSERRAIASGGRPSPRDARSQRVDRRWWQGSG